ncbi:FecR family protein [Stenotrophomonas tumulicola]|uniref:FecR domain-containing protein n=1 Tax=Stenotrophomonas tumulicola TaxID=1685415 RepID=A0A7W3FP28_9GAMM|nr:FecR domain-containing protein [Stenotrophomonas tumulicola]MBA8683126.1 FecR domain-containing protein [Stenotrophomonas tumulicola]
MSNHGNASPAATTAAAVFARASEWVARLDAADCSSAERDAFEDWLAEDPAHLHAWAEAEALHLHTAANANDPWLRAAAARVATPPQPAPIRHAPAAARRRLLPRAATAAAGLCLALGLGALLVLDGLPTPQRVANDSRVPQLQTLADGSVATLDAGSALTTRVGWRKRHIDIERGRVQLQVAPSTKPLRVVAGTSTIVDIGTTFQVERFVDGRIGVALLEGAVAVTSAGAQASEKVLKPGEQLQVLPTGRIETGPPLPAGSAEAWLQGTLVFDGTPLQTVAEQMNRYTATPLVITDPSLAALAFTGRFRAGDQQALLEALQLGWAIEGHPRSDGALVLQRAH